MGEWDRKQLLTLSDEIKDRIALNRDTPTQLAKLLKLYAEVAVFTKTINVNAALVTRARSDYVVIIDSASNH